MLRRYPTLGRRSIAAVATFLVATAAACLAAFWQAGENAEVAEQRFDALAARAADQLARRLQIYEYGLRGARGALIAAGVERLSRKDYRQYSETRDVDREFPGVRGIGVIKRVTPANEAEFLAATRRDGAPDFTIRQLAPHAGDRYVIQYIEPIERNAEAIGLDIASESSRQQAADLAMRTGDATITAPITLVQAQGQRQRAFLLLLPIYYPGTNPVTAEQRQALTLGWAYAPLVIDEVLYGFDFRDGEFVLALRDVSAFDSQPFFQSGSANNEAANGLARRVAVPIYGRTWEAEIRAQPQFVQALNLRSPYSVAAGGLGVAVLLAILMAVYVQSRERGLQVRAEMARRSAILESSNDAIFSETLDGRIIDWNEGARRMFGYPPMEAVGQPVADLLLPDDRRQEDAEVRAAIERGEVMRPFDSVRRTRNGSLVDVSIAVSPIFAPNGTLMGYSRTLRDISEARQAQRSTQEINASLERQVADRTALLETARRDLRNILDAVPSIIGYWDSSLHNRFANHAYGPWLGLDPEALPGRHVRDVLGDGYELLRPQMEAALRGEPQVFEHTLPRLDGPGVRHTLVHYVPDRVEGEIRGFYAIVNDITQQTQDRARLAAAIRENEALLSTIQLHSIFSAADRAGRIIDVNDNFCRITGYERDELIGQNHRIVNSGEQDRAFWVSMWSTIASGLPWRGEVCNQAKDGSLFWVDAIVAPFVGEDGRIERYISIHTDITAVKLNEQRLRASESYLDRVGRVAGVGSWQFALETQEVTWSALTRQILELDANYQPTLDGGFGFAAPQARGLLRSTFESALESGKGWDLELPFITAKGRPIWVRCVGDADIRGDHIVGLVGAFQDITARRLAEEALQRTHERFAVASDAAHLGVWDLDIASQTLGMNDWMYRLFKRERLGDAEPFDAWFECIDVEDRPDVQDRLTRAIRGGRQFEAEFRIHWPDGEIRHMFAAARVVFGADGSALRMSGVNLDITERKRAELELLRTTSLLETMLEAASEVSLIATDPDMTISLFNVGAERLLGYCADEMIGRATTMLVHDPDEVAARAKELSEATGRTVEPSGVFTEPSTLHQPHEWTYLRKDGGRITVSLVVTAMHTPEGKLVGYLGVAHDVTRQKQYEHSLREAMHKAREASNAKTQFLANMSHEIRTPMNAVIGLSYLLGQTPLNDEQAGFLGKIKLASKALLAVINDVLDLSKIEAGELTVEQAPFSLRDALDELRDVMQVHADAKQIAFEIDAPADLPPTLSGDAPRLRQILTNLLANAIKFTPKGAVRLVVRPLAASPAAVTLRFEVHDTGIGIAPDVQARLFTPFAQADTSTTRQFGGTGLGLSIVKRLTNLMGGEVGVSSAPGAGSEFWVVLDFALASAQAGATVEEEMPEPAGYALRGVHVLVVDDSDINLEVARKILLGEGAQVSLASNGQEALDCLRARPDAFDVVLMDVQMPVLDGHEATRRIRSELRMTKLPIIALTAGALTSERERSVITGMDDFVSKPFDAMALCRIIRRHVNLRGGAGSAGAPAAVDAPPLEGEWMAIEGIDLDDARSRIIGDWDLFRRMLRRLLVEFAPATLPTGDEDAAMLAAHASRLHKLRGGAGLLGAKAIQQLAGEAEVACRAGNAPQAGRIARRLAAELQRTQDGAASVLEAQRASDERPAADSAAVNPEALAALLELLRQQSLAALDRFQELSPELRGLLGAESFDQVRTQIDNLEFSDAAQTLQHGPRGGA